ncbi:MAG: transporter [Deltaproteobacteria bacterium]|nr:transporter [Deltaproteobacteria bacterium]
MKRILGIIIAIGFIFAAHSPAYAYRPFATEDAGVAGKGVVQLEVSWDHLKWENKDRDNVFLIVPIYGITERIELSVEIPYMLHDTEDGENEDGIGDINIVGKFLLIEEGDKNPAFTLKAVVKTSSGDYGKGLGSGDKDYSLVAVASKTIGDFQLHGMFGYTFVGDNGDDNIRDIYLYGIGIDYSLTENFHLVAEVAGNRHSDRTIDGDDPASGLVGATYKISEHLTIDGGIRFGFNDSMPDWNTTLGMSITF